MFDRALNTPLSIFPNAFKIYETPADIYLFKVNNRNTRTRGEIFSKLTVKTLASLCCLYC